jgi:TetR/AcrR family transcriptional regulator
MTEEEKNTEEKIFEAAHKVFTTKGFDGARMQEIAEEAGLNKALLHYYYRTKEKLFDAILSTVFKNFFPKVFSFMGADISIQEKIGLFVDKYIDLILGNPFIPNFVIGELNRNPERIVDLLGHQSGLIESGAFKNFSQQIEDEINKGILRPIKPVHLITNIIGLCLFPIIARPILQGIIFNNDKKLYEAYLAKRKEEVKSFVIRSITNKK